SLYIAARCEEQNLALLSNRSVVRDQPDWGDDRIEFFFDALGTGRIPNYYLSINSFGVVADSYIGVGEWDPDLAVRTGREAGAWTMECAIPVTAFGRSSLSGEQWRFNIGRHHRGSVKASSSLVKLEGKFHQPGRFAGLTFKPPREGSLRVTSLSRGELVRGGEITGANRAAYEVVNDGGPRELLLVIENRSGEAQVERQEQKRSVPPGKSLLEQYYRLLGRKDEVVVFQVREGAETLYSDRLQLAQIRPIYRVYDVRDPLFESLFAGGRPRDPRKDGDMIWTQPFHNYLNAVQSGTAYSYDQVRQETSDAGMHPLLHYSPPLPCIDPESYVLRDRKSLPQMAEENRRRGWGGLALYAPYYVMGRDEQGKRGASIGISGWLGDPVNRRAFVASVQAVLDEHGKDLWAVHAGDEQFTRQLHMLDTFFTKDYDPAKPEHAFFRLAEEEIRRDYGFGRFGLPHRLPSTNPDYPFCRRAFLTWVSDKLRQANRELAAAVRAKDPAMPIVAEDTHGGAVLDVEYWSEYADIGAFQAQYSPDPRLQNYAYAVKLAKDISGLDYMLVCPHDCVAGFPTGAMEADELRELYSQIFRAGGTGFNFWAASLGEKAPTPPLAATVQTGYPIAWQHMLAASRLARKLPLLKFPKPDTVVFISSETLKCGVQSGFRGEGVFSLLGPMARGAFRFLSEGLIDLQRARFEDYSILYLPSIKYSRSDTAESIVRFCEQGGTVIGLDPEAFEASIAAEPLKTRERLFGVRLTGPRAKAELWRFDKPVVDGVRELRVYADKEKACDVEVVGPQCRALAVYEDGRPALVENRLGKGRAFYFTWCPFNSKLLSDGDWQRFLIGLHTSVGGSVGHDIWRFKIPEIATCRDTPPEGLCLTGNYAFWDRYQFVEGRRYNAPPDGEYTIESQGKRARRGFVDGPLTNRLMVKTKHKYGGMHPIE
ncbi:MAG TPA: hypothetical protein P5137_11965, partial [Candidatus Brocadiia bacterium]|nr:hypothetical protein [Candidatus Brocadiia bacterium]